MKIFILACFCFYSFQSFAQKRKKIEYFNLEIAMKNSPEPDSFGIKNWHIWRRSIKSKSNDGYPPIVEKEERHFSYITVLIPKGESFIYTNSCFNDTLILHQDSLLKDTSILLDDFTKDYYQEIFDTTTIKKSQVGDKISIFYLEPACGANPSSFLINCEVVSKESVALYEERKYPRRKKKKKIIPISKFLAIEEYLNQKLEPEQTGRNPIEILIRKNRTITKYKGSLSWEIKTLLNNLEK